MFFGCLSKTRSRSRSSPGRPGSLLGLCSAGTSSTALAASRPSTFTRAWTRVSVELRSRRSRSSNGKHELVFRRRAEHPNQTWQSDHTELDILIVGADGKPDRPWLTTVMDDYSRAICGDMVFTGAPSSINTALALRQAIWRKTDPAWAMCGIPDILHVDHGSDFISDNIGRTAVALHIRIIHSTIGRPQGQGKIERFFGTVNTELLAAYPAISGPAAGLQRLSSTSPGSTMRSANSSAPTT